MPSLTKRTLIKFGEKGLVLTIPKAWIDYYHLRAGDRVTLIANGELTISPLVEQDSGKAENKTTNR